jgi:hypothetical protein
VLAERSTYDVTVAWPRDPDDVESPHRIASTLQSEEASFTDASLAEYARHEDQRGDAPACSRSSPMQMCSVLRSRIRFPLRENLPRQGRCYRLEAPRTSALRSSRLPRFNFRLAKPAAASPFAGPQCVEIWRADGVARATSGKCSIHKGEGHPPDSYPTLHYTNEPHVSRLANRVAAACVYSVNP